MAKHNTPKPPPAPRTQGPARGPFYVILLFIALVGTGTILYVQRSPATSEPDPALQELRQNYANAGPPQPYLLGDSAAAVVIEEFADYECPVCGQFATITEPDVRTRIVAAGLAAYKYYDFPLPMHRNSFTASLAAACADEQGKFWEMHDQLFATQDRWGLSPSGAELTNNPRAIFRELAGTIGLEIDQWDDCLTSRKYESRVVANAAEALRRNLEQTPTFFVNGKKWPGVISYDALKKMVDEAQARGPASMMDSAFSNMIKH